MKSLLLLAPLLIAAAEGANPKDEHICHSGNSVDGDDCSDSHLKGKKQNLLLFCTVCNVGNVISFSFLKI